MPRPTIITASGFLGVAGAALTIAMGTALGVGAYTFVYARGGSYLSNDAAACANCHVMQGHFDAWLKSSHHAVATCNDCHTPPNFVGKWWTKARNGYHHSLAFTTGRFHEPIGITESNRAVTESACRACHADVVAAIDAGGSPGHALDCIRCHGEVGHPR